MTVFMQKGDAPLTKAQAIKRGQALLTLDRMPYEREAFAVDDPAAHRTWGRAWNADNVINEANNIFNWSLFYYREAVARLAKYRLADGLPEIIESLPTGELDANGDPVLADVVTQQFIAALPAQVETVLEDGSTAMAPNPLIVADDAERAAAQATIDATPADVVAFANQ